MAEQTEQHFHQKLSFFEKAGYSGGDAAANFVSLRLSAFRRASTRTCSVSAQPPPEPSSWWRVCGTHSSTRSWVFWLIAPTRAGAGSAPGYFGLRFLGRSSWFSLTRRLTSGSRP